jgi:quinol monooxygenase YgiN
LPKKTRKHDVSGNSNSTKTSDSKNNSDGCAFFTGDYEAAKPLLETQATVFHYGWGRDENEFVAVEAWKDDTIVASLRQSPQFNQVFTAMMDCSSGPMRMELVNDLTNDRTIFAAHPPAKSSVHPDIGHGTVYL